MLIVTSHYNEDLNWLVKQTYFDFRIYTKNRNKCTDYPSDKIYDCVNKGFEASSYINFIIDNYNQLPDYVAFIHGHEVSDHQIGTTLDLLISSPKIDYFSINRKDLRNQLHEKTTNPNFYTNWKWVVDNYHEIITDIPIPKKLEYTACAQFIVSKKNILKNSLDFYKKMNDWLIKTELPDYITGRIFEHLWCYIFTHEEIEN